MTGSWQDPLMKVAYHEQFGGSPKHDAADEMFEAGWNAVIEACGGTDHLVVINGLDWTIQHPITERLAGTLFDCKVHGLVDLLIFHERFPAGATKIRIRREPSVVSDTEELTWEVVEGDAHGG